MNTVPHSAVSLRGVCFALALALTAPLAGTPLNDTAAGTGTVLGNALNPGPERTRRQAADWPVARHTPTGQMFRIPYALSQVRKAAGGWEYSGQLEFGWLGGDAGEENARFRMYQDLDHGAYVNNVSLQLRRPEGGYTIDLTAGAAGRDDQYYGLQIGRANLWQVKLFSSAIPHVFTNRYKSLWTGIGTGQLTLLPGLTPGGSGVTATDNANVAAIAQTGGRELGLTRKRSGARVDLDLSNAWKAYISYSLEQRQGARPFGAVWGNNPGSTPIEIPEPIDYDTHDVLAGVSHVGALSAFNFRVSASLFRNQLDTLVFEMPYRIAAQGAQTVPAAGAFTQGRLDLAPNNDAYNARAEYTRSLPDFHKGYFTVVVAAGTWRQDDNLIPYVVTPGISHANVVLQPGGNWDSVSALSRRSADAVIDTRLVDLTLALNPGAMLKLRTKARFYENENDLDPFLAVNPLASYLDADAALAGNQSRGLTLDGVTGVWGRPLNDGSGQSILLGTNANPAGNIVVRSLTYSTRQYRFGTTADYRLGPRLALNSLLEREIARRTNRDRDRTAEDRIKLGLVSRGWRAATFRASYEFGRRRGDDYIPSFYGEAFSAALVPMPATPGTNVSNWVRTNSGFRNLDLADRDQHVVNARADVMVRSNLDAGISVQRREASFPNSPFGQKRNDQDSANLDLHYQPSPARSAYAFYSYQVGRIRQASITGTNGAVIIGQQSPFGLITPENAVAVGSAPGGPVYPLANAWAVGSTDRNHVAGVGLKQDLGKVSLSVDYSYALARTRIRYDYTVGGALNANNAVLAGERMPDLATDFTHLDAALRFPLTERTSARLVYRHQKEAIRDWHYRNVEATPVVLGANAGALPTAVLLDGGPADYRVNWFGVLFQIRL